jgi:dephospho-CoA kinase
MKCNIVYMFCGKAGSGKDTSCTMLEELLEEGSYKRYAFGDVLKKVVVDLSKLYINLDLDFEQMNNLQYKEKVHDNLVVHTESGDVGLSVRALLQQVGTNVMRKHMGADIFVNHVITEMKEQFILKDGQCAIITDLRFPNEFEAVKTFCEYGGYDYVVVLLERPHVSGATEHVSEQMFKKIKADYRIINEGGLKELKQSVELVAKDIEERRAS